MSTILTDATHEFRRHKSLADRAISELSDNEYFRSPASGANSVAIIVKHLSGNLRSRWSDFLGTDGNKLSRDRDSEFVITAADTRTALTAGWEESWDTLFATLGSLGPADLSKTVTIRGEVHSVTQAVLRGMTHAAYHCGQILYLARMLRPDSPWLTIEPGKSSQHVEPYLRRYSGDVQKVRPAEPAEAQAAVIRFEELSWQEAAPKCRIKEVVCGPARLRLVEFQDGFVEDGWCEKGHTGFVLSGALDIQFDDEIVRLSAGDALQIPAGRDHRHRAHVLGDPVRLFLVEQA